jgi:hypothetical protein
VRDISTGIVGKGFLRGFADFGEPFSKGRRRTSESPSSRAIASSPLRKVAAGGFANPFTKAFAKAFWPAERPSITLLKATKRARLRDETANIS